VRGESSRYWHPAVEASVHPFMQLWTYWVFPHGSTQTTFTPPTHWMVQAGSAEQFGRQSGVAQAQTAPSRVGVLVPDASGSGGLDVLSQPARASATSTMNAAHAANARATGATGMSIGMRERPRPGTLPHEAMPRR
jgi:hypothetical protein